MSLVLISANSKICYDASKLYLSRYNGTQELKALPHY